MRNGLGVPQSVVLFGGTSDIGQAVVRNLVQTGTSHLTLVSRDPSSADEFGRQMTETHAGLHVHHVVFDAQDPGKMKQIVEVIVEESSDIDIAVIAQAVLGDGVDYLGSPEASISVSTVNYTSTMVLMLALAEKMRRQRYGKIVLLSSVAGERVRAENMVYGASKAGIDAFALALDNQLGGYGASVLVVRPGFVHSKMTKGLPGVPFSTHPDKVASRTARAVGADKKIVWVPGILRWVMMVLRHLPSPLWRRISR